MEELITRYADRIVIFDSPPLLLTTEAAVLASQMDQVVLLIDSATSARITPICNKARTFPGDDYYRYNDWRAGPTP
jgi:hypothetical protein